jgi:hypothetical protein
MTPHDLTHPDDPALEECLEELEAILSRAGRFPPALVALALRIHLEALLLMMIEQGFCSRGEVRAFLRDLEDQTLSDV